MNSDIPIDDLLMELDHITKVAREAIRLLRFAHEICWLERSCKCAEMDGSCDAAVFLIRNDRGDV